MLKFKNLLREKYYTEDNYYMIKTSFETGIVARLKFVREKKGVTQRKKIGNDFLQF